MVAVALSAGACGGPDGPAPVDPRERPWPAPPDGASYSPYAAEPVPEGEAEEAWRSDAGQGIVAPLLSDGRLVIATTTTGEVRAFSADDGSRHWSFDAGGSIPSGVVPNGGLVIAASGDGVGRVHAISLQGGRARWSRPIGRAAFAPRVVGDTIFIVTRDGRLEALDASTGGSIWTRTLPDPAASAPIAHDGALYLPTTADTLYRLRRRTGEVTGRAPLPGRVSATPARIDRTLIVPFHPGGIVAFDLPSMTERWRTDVGAPVLAAPVAAPDGRVFVLTTSAELWRVDDPARGGALRIASPGGAARGALTVARERVLVGRLDGTLLLLRTDGSVVWEKEFDDSIAAPVAVRDGAIYVPLLRGRIVKLR